MINLNKSILSIRVLIALLLGAMTFSAVHASTYGDGAHDHDGIACSIAIASDDAEAIAPIDFVYTAHEYAAAPPFARAPQTDIVLGFLGRAPPPRAPPL